jgi:aminoglycoside phosphotransferase (APT) family kinase protein
MLLTNTSPDDLAQVLSDELDGTVQELTLLPDSMAHRMYSALWEQPDGPVPIVVRFFSGPRAEDDARVEAGALRDLCRAGYPVPECYALECDDHPAGAPFIVMQRLPGESLATAALDQPERIADWLEQASILLFKLHSLSWHNTFDLFKPALDPLDFAERQIKWWGRQAQVVGAEDAEEGFSWLRANLYRARRSSGSSLIHRDFHPGNLLVDVGGITGVVDWGELTLGDPAVDVAWTRMILSTEVSAELGDEFAEAYYRRNPAVAETLSFWEVFSACKRQTRIAWLSDASRANGHHYGSRPVFRPNLQNALRDFMRQRLTEDDLD